MDAVQSWESRAKDLVARARAMAGSASEAEKQALLQEVRDLQAERGVSLLLPTGAAFNEQLGRVPEPRRRHQQRRCPAGGACEGSGWVLIDDDQAQPCPCQEDQGRPRNRFRRFAPRNLTLSLDSPPLAQLPEPVRAAAARFAENLAVDGQQGLWLTGPPGSGKTSLAVYIADQAAKKELDVGFYPLHELLGRLARAPVETSESLAGRDLVVIDDLDGRKLDRARVAGQGADVGVRQPLSRDLDRLCFALDELEHDQVSLVITSELDQDQLERRFACRGRVDLVHCCLEAARSGNSQQWEELRIELRARRILRRLQALCPVSLECGTEAVASGGRKKIES